MGRTIYQISSNLILLQILGRRQILKMGQHLDISDNANEINLLLFRTAGSVFKDMIFIFGGHNGTILLNDFYYFNVCKLRLSIPVHISFYFKQLKCGQKLITTSDSLHRRETPIRW